VRRLSIRSEPSLSSLILTSSPGFTPSRSRKSAGRTSRPRSSSLAFPLRRRTWETIARAHIWSQVGQAQAGLNRRTSSDDRNRLRAGRRRINASATPRSRCSPTRPSTRPITRAAPLAADALTPGVARLSRSDCSN
jgi:hypothetical protein